MTTQILIVEDDKGLREGVALALQREGVFFTLCGNIAEAREALSGEAAFSLLLLDLNLPDGSGYELLKEVKEGSSLPVIILTANDMEMDEVKGLMLGADDYITKPFSLMVLRARIDKVLKNAAVPSPKEYSGTGEGGKDSYCFGELFFDFRDMRFERRKPSGEKEEINLSKTEQKLLQYLVENKNILLSRDRLIDKIWTDGAEYVDENALSVAVGRLRAKLSEGAEGHLQTVYGKGYVWKV